MAATGVRSEHLRGRIAQSCDDFRLKKFGSPADGSGDRVSPVLTF